jgi:hypothetical protein
MLIAALLAHHVHKKISRKFRLLFHPVFLPARVLLHFIDVTVLPKCTLRGLGTPYHSTPTARYVDKKRLEDEGHLQGLCSIYAFCHNHKQVASLPVASS